MKKIVVVVFIEDIFVYNVGIFFKDVIIKIDGKFIDGMEVDDVVKLIWGKFGISVVFIIEWEG